MAPPAYCIETTKLMLGQAQTDTWVSMREVLPPLCNHFKDQTHEGEIATEGWHIPQQKLLLPINERLTRKPLFLYAFLFPFPPETRYSLYFNLVQYISAHTHIFHHHCLCHCV